MRFEYLLHRRCVSFIHRTHGIAAVGQNRCHRFPHRLVFRDYFLDRFLKFRLLDAVSFDSLSGGQYFHSSTVEFDGILRIFCLMAEEQIPNRVLITGFIWINGCCHERVGRLISHLRHGGYPVFV